MFLVSANRGLGLHTVERVEALFPDHFRNFVFVSVGTVDSESFGSEQSLRTLQYETRATLDGLVNYAHVHGKGSRWYDAYGADRLAELEHLALEGAGTVSQQCVLLEPARLRTRPLVDPLAAQPDAARHAARAQPARPRTGDPAGHVAGHAACHRTLPSQRNEARFA